MSDESIVQEMEGWFVVNVADARWVESPDFGKRCVFEGQERFPSLGIGISVLEPGKPACRYHREEAQEDFLVLHGECRLLVNGEERMLKAWDFVHCPAGVTHVFIGAGDGPCAILMVGDRPENLRFHYPKHEIAARYGAESPEATGDPAVAYRDITRHADCDAPRWPLDES